MRILFSLFVLILLAGGFFLTQIPSSEIELPEVKLEIPEEPAIEVLKKELESISEAIKTMAPPFIPSAPVVSPVEPVEGPPPPPLPSEALSEGGPAIKSSEIYATAIEAIVNISCYDAGKRLYILGSGAIIHPLGYILTNAHLAEHFAEGGTECSLRRGSPAKNFAKAKIIWIPDQNKNIGDTEIPENDAAILKIMEIVDGSPFQAGFKHFKFEPGYKVKEGETLYSLSYPTEFLGSETAIKNTNLVFTLGTVEELVTIDDDAGTAEGAYLKGELSAQHGSSGGVFLDAQEGRVVGLFVGITEGETTAERKQFMFLASYIDRILFKTEGMDFPAFLATHP